MAVIDIRQDLGCLVRCDVAFELGMMKPKAAQEKQTIITMPATKADR